MQIAILGPLEVRDDAGRTVEISGARLRSLLARLALDAGRWVSPPALIDAVWGERPPADATNALQTLVSRIRRAVGDPGVIASSAAGYRLVVETVDLRSFEAKVREAGANPADAVELLRDGLALWRGPALADAGEQLADDAARLEQLRLAARVELAHARSVAGSTELAELEQLALDAPLDERVAVLLFRALAAAGRQAEALQAYETLRVQLAEELGVDPAAETRAAHLELLQGTSVPTPSAGQRRSNLRVPLTTFVGRETDLETIRARLVDHRLVTLVGPGGAGKTRLASEAARGLLDETPDGVWLAELAAVTSGDDVAQAVLASVGLRELHSGDANAPRDPIARLVETLGPRGLLIVLDNCEHVVDAAAALAETLLGACPGLRVVATSREPLGIGGESLYPVLPLTRPDDGVNPDRARDYAAVALFADRAADARPDFRLDETSVAAVVEIVRRLDGLPLAIELAAARLRSLPLEDIAARLSDRFRLLTGGSRTALPRHRTLRAVVEWSWDLLEPRERELAELLAVFPAGVTAASAAAMTDADESDTLDLLAALTDKSLLQPVGDGRRMRMLETIREYGTERLDERDELRDARQRHADYFAGLLRDASPRLLTRDQVPWFALVRAEQENAVAAMRFLIAHADADRALQLALDLATAAMLVGEQDESSGWLGEALTVAGGNADLRLVARSFRAVTTDFGTSTKSLDPDELRTMVRELADVDIGNAPLLTMLRPGIAFLAGDMPLAHRQLEASLLDPDPWIRACSHMFATNLYENDGEVEKMRVEAAIAVEQFRALGERWGLATSLRQIGQIATLDGDLDAAAAAYAESMEAMRELSSHDDMIFLLGELADLAMRRGDTASARAYLDRAVGEAQRQTSEFESFFAWTRVAEMERVAGSRSRARELAEGSAARLAQMALDTPVQNYVGAMLFRLLGALDLDDGDEGAARAQAVRSYQAAINTRDLPIVALVGVFVARLSATTDAPLAARQLGAAARLRGSADATAPEIRALTEQLQSELGEADFDRLYAAGRALGRDEAFAILDPA